jgi:curved DNA-binding protein CbpA
MASLHTHYDNLKVARDAPPEVIRAAYKTLSQKFHPDRNPGNPEAARIMAIINASYDVLSDPAKRKEHDTWIKQNEHLSATTATANDHPKQSPAPRPASTPLLKPEPRKGEAFLQHLVRFWFLYGIAIFFIWISTVDKPTPPRRDQNHIRQVRPLPVRPTFGPRWRRTGVRGPG